MASSLIIYLEKLGLIAPKDVPGLLDLPDVGDFNVMSLLFGRYLIDSEISSIIALASQSKEIDQFLNSDFSISFWKKRLKRDQPSTYATLVFQGEPQQHITDTLPKTMNIYKAFYMRNLRLSVLVSNMDHIVVPDENIKNVNIQKRGLNFYKRFGQRYFVYKEEDVTYLVDWTSPERNAILLEYSTTVRLLPLAITDSYVVTFAWRAPFFFAIYDLAKGKWVPDNSSDVPAVVREFHKRPIPGFVNVAVDSDDIATKENVVPVSVMPHNRKGYFDVKNYSKMSLVADNVQELSESCLVIEPIRQLMLELGGYISFQELIAEAQPAWYAKLLNLFRTTPEEFTVSFKRIGEDKLYQIPKKLLQNYAGPIPTGIGEIITSVDNTGNITLISLTSGAIRPAPRRIHNRSFESIQHDELLEYSPSFYFSDMILWAKRNHVYFLADDPEDTPVFVITKHRSAATLTVNQTFMEGVGRGMEGALVINAIAFNGTDILLEFRGQAAGEQYYSLSIGDLIEEKGVQISSAFGGIAAKQCVWCTLETDSDCSECGTPYCDKVCQAEDWIGHQKYCQLLSNLH